MAIKAVEIIRSIRDRHYEQTKGLSIKEQIEFIRRKSKELRKELKIVQRSTADNTAQTPKI